MATCSPARQCGDVCIPIPVDLGSPEYCCCPRCMPVGSKCSPPEGELGGQVDPEKCGCNEIVKPPNVIALLRKCFVLTGRSCSGVCKPAKCPSGCGCGGSCGCHRGGGCQCGGASPGSGFGSIAFAATRIMHVQHKAQLCVPGTGHHSPGVNPANGNLVLQLSPPSSGPFTPQPMLTYNSRASDQTAPFGYGWADLFNPTVSSTGSTSALLVDGEGASYDYTDKDATGRYLAPAGAASALATLAGSGWVETQPGGLELRYESTGALEKLVSSL